MYIFIQRVQTRLFFFSFFLFFLYLNIYKESIKEVSPTTVPSLPYSQIYSNLFFYFVLFGQVGKCLSFLNTSGGQGEDASMNDDEIKKIKRRKR